MEENVIQINGRITKNVNVNVKNIMYVKKIMFGILLNVIVKMENVQQIPWIIQQLRMMKLQNHTMKKQKQILTNFNEKEANCKMQNFFI